MRENQLRDDVGPLALDALSSAGRKLLLSDVSACSDLHDDIGWHSVIQKSVVSLYVLIYILSWKVSQLNSMNWPIFVYDHASLYSVSQKIPPATFLTFSPNGWESFNQFLHTYYTFLSTLDDKFLFNYLQFWRSYAILCATTQRIFTFH